MRKLKQELIEKLRIGECIIDNTGNPDVELLRLVMNEAFKTNYIIRGTDLYYGKSSIGNNYSCSNNISTINLTGWENIIPLKDFEEKELTELPKKWCVKVVRGTGEQLNVLNWFEKKLNRVVGLSKVTYFHYPEIRINTCTTNEIEPSYTEISFKDFERLVLKKNNMENRKIIGYKAPYDLYNGDIKKGDIFFSNGCGYYHAYKNNKKVDGEFKHSTGIPKEIVETWEVVYEEELKLPKIHGYEGKYDSKNNLIIYGCKEIPVAAINYLKSCNEVLKNKTSSSIGHIVLDSIIITMDDIYKIEDFINGQSNS